MIPRWLDARSAACSCCAPRSLTHAPTDPSRSLARSPPLSLSPQLFIVNRVVDIIFILDLCLQFTIMYKIEDAVHGVRWVDDPSAIAKQYLTGWFGVDLFSTLPSICDFLCALACPEPFGSQSAPRARTPCPHPVPAPRAPTPCPHPVPVPRARTPWTPEGKSSPRTHASNCL